ncbi:MAG: pitrilysin family protein [Planctomycetota bacterium]
MPAPATQTGEFFHQQLSSGVECAADVLPERSTVAMCFRILTGLADEPAELTGISSIMEQTLSKGTQRFDGRGLSDAFDALGARWSSVSGRQSTMVRVICLPEFVSQVVDLVGEMICHPTFPAEACRVAVELAQQDLRNMEDEPHDLLRVLIQRLTLGPVLGRHPGGESDTLPRITPELVRSHWQEFFRPGRIQVAVAGPVDPEDLLGNIDAAFAPLGRSEPAGRQPADFEFQPGRQHRHKELEQEYLAITLPGLPREHEDFAVEQVLLRVLSGGMSARLFTEVREKLGLVYWVGAWHEQPRGKGIIHLGASTTPQRCQQTFDKLLEELGRISRDLTDEEVRRARDGLIAHLETEDDLTRARATDLSEDLFFHSRPIGPAVKLAALRAVTRARVEAYASALPRDQLCVATLGPREL